MLEVVLRNLDEASPVAWGVAEGEMSVLESLT